MQKESLRMKGTVFPIIGQNWLSHFPFDLTRKGKTVTAIKCVGFSAFRSKVEKEIALVSLKPIKTPLGSIKDCVFVVQIKTNKRPLQLLSLPLPWERPPRLSSSLSSLMSSMMRSYRLSRLPWLRHVLTVEPELSWEGLGFTTLGFLLTWRLRGCTHSVPGTWGSGGTGNRPSLIRLVGMMSPLGDFVSNVSMMSTSSKVWVDMQNDVLRFVVWLWRHKQSTVKQSIVFHPCVCTVCACWNVCA